MKILIVLPVPPKQLRPNGRFHWRMVARHKKEYRWAAYAQSLEAISKMREPPYFEKAYMTIVYYARTAHKQDRDNIIASLKSAIDGIVDARIVTDDAHISYPRVDRLVDRVSPRVEITVSDTFP